MKSSNTVPLFPFHASELARGLMAAVIVKGSIDVAMLANTTTGAVAALMVAGLIVAGIFSVGAKTSPAGEAA